MSRPDENLALEAEGSESARVVNPDPETTSRPRERSRSATLDAIGATLGRKLGNVRRKFTSRQSASGSTMVARPGITHNEMTMEEHQRWMQSKEENLAKVRRQARAARAESHADTAVLEEWLQGNISDEQLQSYMKAHSERTHCRSMLARYRELKHR